jgi:GNAT superfamily N-acetyltransferase
MMSHDEAPSPDINSVWIIRKPMPEEQALLASLLLKSVRDTWRKNGLELEHSDFQDEMHSRLECLSRFFSGESDIVDIRIIEEDPPGKIRGLAALYPPGKTMIRNLQSRLDASHAELGLFYIDPEHHRRGLGRELFGSMNRLAVRRSQSLLVLGSGYTSSQRYWNRILGEADAIERDRWGPGQHEMMWIWDPRGFDPAGRFR